MNQPSVFQLQYPLSPRKFWKKVIAKFSFWVIFLIITAIIEKVFISPYISDVPQIATPIVTALWIFSGIILISLVLYCFYISAYIKRYYYDCGEQFVTIKKGVFAPTEIHVQYQKIQDVYVDQDILDRIMGLYDVHIASATITSGIEAHIDGVNQDVAESLKNIILGKIHGTSNPSVSSQTSTVQPQTPQPSPLQFSQKISSVTYPISGAWVVSVIWSSLIYSLIYSLILTKILLILGLFYGLVIFGILFFIHLIYQSIWKQNYYFEFTPEYILLRTGVISRSENHLPYKSIQNVLNKQGIVDRVLGLSTVTIQNAAQQMLGSRGQAPKGSGISLVWQPKEKADELSQALNDITSKINPQNFSAMGV